MNAATMSQSTNTTDFPINDYRAMLQTRHSASALLGISSMEPWPRGDAARLMAIVQVWGNNEGFTLSPKFNADREYIQTLYGLRGGGEPDPVFAHHLKIWARAFEAVQSDKDMDFQLAHGWIRTMYGFELLR